MRHINTTITYGTIILIPLLLIVSLAYYFSKEKETEGKVPSREMSQYLLLYIKDDVFTETKILTEDAKSWMKVVNSNKDNIQLCAVDTARFKTFFTQDSIALKTISMFPDHGFQWEHDEDLGWCFTLPRSQVWDDKSNYVTVPSWLMAKLIDVNAFDMDETILQQPKDNSSNNILAWGGLLLVLVIIFFYYIKKKFIAKK